MQTLSASLTSPGLWSWYREAIREKLIPHAVSWYTGDAIEVEEDDDDEDEDEDEDDEDEDDDDDGDEDDEVTSLSRRRNPSLSQGRTLLLPAVMIVRAADT